MRRPKRPLAEWEKLITDYDVEELIIWNQLRLASLLAGTPRAKSIALNNTADMYLFEARLLDEYLTRSGEDAQFDQKKRAEKLQKANAAIALAKDYITDAKRLVHAAPVVYLTEVEAKCRGLRLGQSRTPTVGSRTGSKGPSPKSRSSWNWRRDSNSAVTKTLKPSTASSRTPPFDILTALVENVDDLKHTYRLRLSRALHLKDQ